MPHSKRAFIAAILFIHALVGASSAHALPKFPLRQSAICAAYLMGVSDLYQPLSQLGTDPAIHDLRAFSIRRLGQAAANPSITPVKYADENSSKRTKRKVAERIRGIQLTNSEEIKSMAIEIEGASDIRQFLNQSINHAQGIGLKGPKAYIYVNTAVLLYALANRTWEDWMNMDIGPEYYPALIMATTMGAAIMELDSTFLRWIPNLNFTHRRWINHVQAILDGEDSDPQGQSWAFASVEGQISSELQKAIMARKPRLDAELFRHYRTENSGSLFRVLDGAVRAFDPDIHPSRYDHAMPMEWVSVDLLFRFKEDETDGQSIPLLSVVVRTGKKRPNAFATEKESETEAQAVLSPAGLQ